MVLPHNSALISCVPGKAWLPAWLKSLMTIASPVALAGSLFPSYSVSASSIVTTFFLILVCTGGGSPGMLCV